MFALILSVKIIPAVSFSVNKPDEQIATVSLKTSGSDYELPFIPVETNHDWDNGKVTTPATCTEPGVRTYTCSICDEKKTEIIEAKGHDPADAVRENEIAATGTEAGSYEEVVYCLVCDAEISRNYVNIPALGPSETELSFIDGEIVIVVPRGAVPDGSEFDVQKIVPPPADFVGKVESQMVSSSRVLAYYEVRLNDTDDTPINHLDGEITVKTKMPERYVGSDYIHFLQQDETGNLIVMPLWWENDYLCYKTDWLEIYN